MEKDDNSISDISELELLKNIYPEEILELITKKEIYYGKQRFKKVL